MLRYINFNSICRVSLEFVAGNLCLYPRNLLLLVPYICSLEMLRDSTFLWFSFLNDTPHCVNHIGDIESYHQNMHIHQLHVFLHQPPSLPPFFPMYIRMECCYFSIYLFGPIWNRAHLLKSIPACSPCTCDVSIILQPKMQFQSILYRSKWWN